MMNLEKHTQVRPLQEYTRKKHKCMGVLGWKMITATEA